MADKLEVEVQGNLTTADDSPKAPDVTAVEPEQPAPLNANTIEKVVEEGDEADADKTRWHIRSLETCTDITKCSEATYMKLMGLYNLAQPDASGTLAKLTKIHNDLERLLAGLV